MGCRMPQAAVPEPVHRISKVRVCLCGRTLANEKVPAVRQQSGQEEMVSMQSPLQIPTQQIGAGREEDATRFPQGTH